MNKLLTDMNRAMTKFFDVHENDYQGFSYVA